MSGHNQPEGRGRLVELETSDCLTLLRGKRVGRLAWFGARGPQVAPVNYIVDEDDTIMFRTSPHSGLTKALYETEVAFEVDETDEFLEEGWSVLVVGTATYLRDDAAVPAEIEQRPRPWASGDRTMYIKIAPRSITGRRVEAG